jgi:hypothetical protein
MIASESNIPTTAATVAGMGPPLNKKTNATNNSPSGQRKRISILALGPNGRFMVTGRNAQALKALVVAGQRGIITLELSNTWALRLGAYIHQLRHDYGLDIETLREPHDGGWHGRYVLHTPCQIIGGAA